MAATASGDGQRDDDNSVAAAMSLASTFLSPLRCRGSPGGGYYVHRTIRGYSQGTVDPGEIERFRRLAGQWGDREGPFKLLHRMTPLRIQYIREQWSHRQDWRHLRVLDVGTGGGLLALV